MVQSFDKSQNIDKASALPGRTTPMPVATLNEVTGHSMTFVPEGLATAIFGMGCFWGVERLFWQQPGIYSNCSRLQRWLYAKSNLSRGMQRPDRACRSGTRSL